MSSRHPSLVGLLMLTMGAALSLTSAPAVAAEPAGSCPWNGCSDGQAAEGSVSVTVSGTGTRAGSGSFTVETQAVTVQPTCWFQKSPWTGVKMDEFATATANHPGMTYLPDGAVYGPDLAPERIAEFATDAEGVWYYAKCSGRNFSGEWDEFDAVRNAYLASNDWLFVPAGVAPPVPEVPVETLMEIAFRQVALPDPEVEWNPQLRGNAATIVNMDTWVWLVDPAQELEVTATAGANSATVYATQQTMTLSAPSADTAVCQGSGVEWTPAAQGECSIVFTRSSANQPDLRTPLTVSTGWATRWSGNGVDRGALEPQTMTSVVGIPVAEIQTTIT